MFDQQTITIKSGEGKSYFEATAKLDSITSPGLITALMDGLKSMQKDRMQFASDEAAKK